MGFFGFHTGPTGHGVPKEKLQALHDLGIPFFVKAIDGYGHCFEAANIAKAGNVPHTIIFRLTTAGQNDGKDYDVPKYHLTPLQAAQDHWQITKAKLPPEFDKQWAWVEICNEVDKNRADWVGNFLTEIAILANGQGYKITGPGWSSGEPELDHWHTAGMLRYLRYCADSPGKAAVSVHEYDLLMVGFAHASVLGWHIGRFNDILNTCDLHSIPYPEIHITEFGWSLGQIPPIATCMSELDWAYRNVYGEHGRHVKGAAIWCLQRYGLTTIHDQAQKLIVPVTEYNMTLPPVDPPPPPPPTGETLEQFIWRTALEIAPTNNEAALQMAITGGVYDSTRYWPYGVEKWATYAGDGKKYAIQPAMMWSSPLKRRAYYCLVPEWGNVKHIDGPGSGTAPPEFRFTHWPTEYKTVTQVFGNNPAYYNQFGLPGHEGVDVKAPHGSKVFSVASGVVSDLNQSPTIHNYGRFIRIKHSGGYETTYAHLNSIQSGLTVGTAVNGGQLIGMADNTGNSFGSHLHLTLKHDNAVPGGSHYINYPYKIVDPMPFVRPFDPVMPGPPPAQTIDLRLFMQAHPDCWRVVRHPDGNQEDVQDLALSGGFWVRRKNQLGEWWKQDAQYHYLVHDTSPAPGNQGIERVYTLTKNGVPGAPKNPVIMTPGVLWTESGSHHVQFRAKATCALLSENSGNAQNTAVITHYAKNYTFNGYGQNLVFDEVVWIKTGVETQVYGRQAGKSCGWIGWSAPWGSSEPVEIWWDRGRLTQEPNRICPF